MGGCFLIGFLVGVCSGALQFWLLTKFTGPAASVKKQHKTLFFALSQFLLPFCVLVGCAFFLSASMLWVGIGMAVSMIICAIIKLIISRR